MGHHLHEVRDQGHPDACQGPGGHADAGILYSGLYYQSFMAVIYYCNDNCLYYKPMIVANFALGRSINYDHKVHFKLKRIFPIMNYDPKHL